MERYSVSYSTNRGEHCRWFDTSVAMEKFIAHLHYEATIKYGERIIGGVTRNPAPEHKRTWIYWYELPPFYTADVAPYFDEADVDSYRVAEQMNLGTRLPD